MFEANYPVLSVLIFFPLLACLGVVLLRNPRIVRWYTLIVTLVELGLALPLLNFATDTSTFQFVEQKTWVKTWGLNYFVGIDGISLLMVALTVAIMPLCVLCSWKYIDQLRNHINALSKRQS